MVAVEVQGASTAQATSQDYESMLQAVSCTVHQEWCTWL